MNWQVYVSLTKADHTPKLFRCSDNYCQPCEWPWRFRTFSMKIRYSGMRPLWPFWKPLVRTGRRRGRHCFHFASAAAHDQVKGLENGAFSWLVVTDEQVHLVIEINAELEKTSEIMKFQLCNDLAQLFFAPLGFVWVLVFMLVVPLDWPKVDTKACWCFSSACSTQRP